MIVTGLVVLSIPKPPGKPARGADILIADSAADLPAGGKLGSVCASPDGDVAVATPLQAIKSRLSRMISNPPNAYAHLRDWGLRVRRGALARPHDLARMQVQMERMLGEDPDVRQASVELTVGPAGSTHAIFVRVSIVTTFGNDAFTTQLQGG
jgi:hypothetical protein